IVDGEKRIRTISDAPGRAREPSVKVIAASLPGIVVIEPDVYRDDRGFFVETYQARSYAESGINASFVQDNHSRSVYRTVRALHAQRDHPQGKLVRVISGSIFDVAV